MMTKIEPILKIPATFLTNQKPKFRIKTLTKIPHKPRFFFNSFCFGVLKKSFFYHCLFLVFQVFYSGIFFFSGIVVVVMNNKWRRQKGEIHHREMQGTRSHSRKPPLATWQPTVPSWEKKFCSLIGSVPWQKLLETKRFMHLYDNVVQWNDSAGEEAFYNAKNRFWAEINGLPCDIRLPDPNSFIDKIDWDSEIDPELLLDLEREPNVPDEMDKNENVVLLGNSLLLNQSFSCGGWGDAEEGVVKENNMSSHRKNVDCETSWEHNCALSNGNVKDSGYGNSGNNAWEWYPRENNEPKYADYSRGGEWGAWDVTRRKRGGACQYMSRYKTSRFHGDNHQNNRQWKNVRGRQRTNFVYEKPPVDRTQWNSMSYCGWAN